MHHPQRNFIEIAYLPINEGDFYSVATKYLHTSPFHHQPTSVSSTCGVRYTIVESSYPENL